MAQNAAIGVVEKGATPGAFGTLPWVDHKRGRLKTSAALMNWTSLPWVSSSFI